MKIEVKVGIIAGIAGLLLGFAVGWAAARSNTMKVTQTNGNWKYEYEIPKP